MNYIEIKNWKKYQGDKNGKLLEGGSTWIKDYTDKEGDEDYCQLTCLQRYLYDGLRRLRGRFGRNTKLDVDFINRKLDIGKNDKPHTPEAIVRFLDLNLISLVTEEGEKVPSAAVTTIKSELCTSRRKAKTAEVRLVLPEVSVTESVTSLPKEEKKRVEKNQSEEPASLVGGSVGTGFTSGAINFCDAVHKLFKFPELTPEQQTQWYTAASVIPAPRKELFSALEWLKENPQSGVTNPDKFPGWHYVITTAALPMVMIQQKADKIISFVKQQQTAKPKPTKVNPNKKYAYQNIQQELEGEEV